MNCAWSELISILPQEYKQEVDRIGKQTAQEVRLRIGKPPEVITQQKSVWLSTPVCQEHIRHVINMASRYSPWSSDTMQMGYLTAPGGHRIGLCGQASAKGFREVTSLNIRIARDYAGIAASLPQDGNLLIIGPPGCGKTTLLRDYLRLLSKHTMVSVVDERGELFPNSMTQGTKLDILEGKRKPDAIEILLRTMGPEVIGVDEITSDDDCQAILSAAWCGVRVVATAHATSARDLRERKIYSSIPQIGIFHHLVVMKRDKSWTLERMG